MSQFLTDQRISQLLDTQVVLGAMDRKSQAHFFNLNAVSGETQEMLLQLVPIKTCSFLSDLNMLLQLELALLIFRRFKIIIVTYFR